MNGDALEAAQEADDDIGHFVPLSRRNSSVHEFLAEGLQAIDRATSTRDLSDLVPPADTASIRSIGSRLLVTSASVTSLASRGSKAAKSPLINEKSKLLAHAEPLPPPPLQKWIGIALTCALSYALYNISIKKGSANLHPVLGGVILQFVAAMLGAMLWTVQYVRGRESLRNLSKDGLKWSIGAGLWVGIAEMVSFGVSGAGVPATQFIPIIIGGSVLFGAVLGILTLGEVLMCHGWSGVALLCSGIALVASCGAMVEGGGDSDLTVAPPLALWTGPALFCALAYACYNICIKKGSSHISPILGGVILQIVAALFGSCLLLALVANGQSLPYDGYGILWACWAGIFVGAAELLSFCVSGLGVQATQSIPIIIGGSVMFGAVLGVIMLGEELVLRGWGGVLLLMIGISFVATDPGEKVQGH